MSNLCILTTSTGLTVTIVLEFAPALDAKHTFLLQAYILKIAIVILVTWHIFFKTHSSIIIVLLFESRKIISHNNDSQFIEILFTLIDIYYLIERFL
jgi:hypothetical protein